jgi:hypothetical protein
MCCSCFQVFFRCFSTVSDACVNCFICLQTYVASVVSGCFKSRSGVASPSSPSAALHPFQTAEGVQRGPAKGVHRGSADGTCQGIVART